MYFNINSYNLWKCKINKCKIKDLSFHLEGPELKNAEQTEKTFYTLK